VFVTLHHIDRAGGSGPAAPVLARPVLVAISKNSINKKYVKYVVICKMINIFYSKIY